MGGEYIFYAVFGTLVLICVVGIYIEISAWVKRHKQHGSKNIDSIAQSSPTLEFRVPAASKYAYRRRQYFMTRAEHDLYVVLKQLYGERYEVFPQVHLDKFLDHKVTGQDFRAALSSIQRKSVDFLICGKGYCTPLVAIELDDGSHMQPERIERDKALEAICAAANMPIVRIKWRTSYDAGEIKFAIDQQLNIVNTRR